MLGLSTDVFSLNPFATAAAATTMAGPVEGVSSSSTASKMEGEEAEEGGGSGRSGDLVVGGDGDGEADPESSLSEAATAASDVPGGGDGDAISISPLGASLVDVLSAVYGTLLLLDSSRRIRSFYLFC